MGRRVEEQECKVSGNPGKSWEGEEISGKWMGLTGFENLLLLKNSPTKKNHFSKRTK